MQGRDEQIRLAIAFHERCLLTASTFERQAISAGERVLQACGFVVVLCVLGAGFVSPDPPSHGAADDAVLAFYQQHAGGVLLGAYLWAVAMLALVLFGVLLGRACERAVANGADGERATGPVSMLPAQAAVLFSVVAACIFTVSNAAGSVAAVSALRAAPASTVRALDEVSHMVSHFGILPLGSFLLSAGVGLVRARRGARWIGWLGVVAGAVLMLSSCWIAVRVQWLHNAQVIGLLMFLVWCGAASVSLLREPRVAGVPAPVSGAEPVEG
jgi:hypothetical protein